MRERAVAVLRDDPADPIVLIVFEDDDLLALRAAQRARERQVGAVRDAPAEDQPRGRRQRIALGAEGRRDHRLDAERLAEDPADRGRDRAGQQRARTPAAAAPPRTAAPRSAAAPAAPRCVRSVAWPSSSEKMSTSGSGGSELSDVREPARRAAEAERDVVGLLGHADARLRLDVEDRLDPRRR